MAILMESIRFWVNRMSLMSCITFTPHSSESSCSVLSCMNVIVSAFKLSFCITNEVFFSNDFSGSLAAEMESVSLMNESLPTPFILMVSVSV